MPNAAPHLQEVPNHLRVFGPGDVGCYADGSLGHGHVRETLATLLEGLDLPGAPNVGELVESLRSDDWPDDLGDELEAIDIIQANTMEGQAWEMDGGDLLLRVDSDDD